MTIGFLVELFTPSPSLTPTPCTSWIGNNLEALKNLLQSTFAISNSAISNKYRTTFWVPRSHFARYLELFLEI